MKPRLTISGALSNDGGSAITFNGGKSWSKVGLEKSEHIADHTVQIDGRPLGHGGLTRARKAGNDSKANRISDEGEDYRRHHTSLFQREDGR